MHPLVKQLVIAYGEAKTVARCHCPQKIFQRRPIILFLPDSDIVTASLFRHVLRNIEQLTQVVIRCSEKRGQGNEKLVSPGNQRVKSNVSLDEISDHFI